MEPNKPLISVVVPVYNMERYLERCVDSILAQDYANLELILVDDGSTDKSLSICHRYRQTDPRVKVLHQENGGQGSARNAGIDIAQGEYLGFVDSDDTVMPDMYSYLLRLCQDNSAQIAVAGMFYDKAAVQKKISETVMGHDEFFPKLLADEISSHPCNKLFGRALWDGIRFPQRNSVDDMMIMPALFDRADRVVVSNKNVYLYYNDRPDSVSNSKLTTHINAYERFVAFGERYRIAGERGITDRQEVILAKAVGFAIGAFSRMYPQVEYQEECEAIRSFFRAHAKTISANAKLQFARKAAAAMIRKCPQFYNIIYHIAKR